MSTIKDGKLIFASRRGICVNAHEKLGEAAYAISGPLIKKLEELDLIYRTLCAIMYNFVPTSGHPGGSISSGRIVESLLYSTMQYSLSNPDDPAADIISYAAGHKAMGLYAMWALRNEIMKQYNEKLLPENTRKQLRLEDLLGFRRNPTQDTPLFKKYEAKALDGHPSPLIPFVRLSTGASGVGVGSSFGLAFAARDCYGCNAPFVHVIEGEGGLTPGRVHEAMAAAATAELNNVVLHVDWNQASIDSNRVCRDGGLPGDYVQWNPMEFGYIHDWNVIYVPNGFDFEQVITAQRIAVSDTNDQPTCIVYRTVKGWRYGIEGRASHGEGHKFCSEEFSTALEPFEKHFSLKFPCFSGDKSEEGIEQLYFDYLMCIRQAIAKNPDLVKSLGTQLQGAEKALKAAKRNWRKEAPEIQKLYSFSAQETPTGVSIAPGQNDTLRESLGRVLSYLNNASKGAIFLSAADLCASTSIKKANEAFCDGFWNAASNPNSRLIAMGGICEDAMGAIMTGISAYGASIGASSSYGAFLAPLQHIAARLHAIAQQGRHDYNGEAANPFIMICAHAGLKTGEDGPTHADPQSLQLLQENFPRGSIVTLTPWDPNELWPVMITALKRRPAVIAVFVTRPTEKVMDRAMLRMPPADAAASGIYAIRRADPNKKTHHGTLVLQGSGEMNVFVAEVLPKIDEAGLNMNIYYIASSELFDLLPEVEQEKIFPSMQRQEAMGITGFTLATLYRWVVSVKGQKESLHPFMGGRFPGSGEARKVLKEVRLDGEAQWEAISRYAQEI